ITNALLYQLSYPGARAVYFNGKWRLITRRDRARSLPWAPERSVWDIYDWAPRLAAVSRGPVLFRKKTAGPGRMTDTRSPSTSDLPAVAHFAGQLPSVFSYS